MAFRRRFRSRRRPFRRAHRRTARMGFRRRRRFFPRRHSRVMHFKQTFLQEAILVTTSTVNKSFAFSLNNLPNVSRYNGLFDAYRINKIVIRMVPSQNSWNANISTSNYELPQIVDLIDYDDNVQLSQTNQYLQYNTHRVHRGDNGWVRKFTPAIALATLNLAVTTPTVQKFKQWIDMGAADVPHYGYKIQMVPYNTTLGSNYRLEMFVTMYFSCKQVR